jgi:hypothetical protein
MASYICNELVVHAIKGIVPPAKNRVQDRHVQVDWVSRERRGSTASNHIFEPQDGFLGGLLPPTILEVEYEGEGLGGVYIVRVVDGDLASSDVNIRNAGKSQVQVVERIHLTLALGAGLVRADV